MGFSFDVILLGMKSYLFPNPKTCCRGAAKAIAKRRAKRASTTRPKNIFPCKFLFEKCKNNGKDGRHCVEGHVESEMEGISAFVHKEMARATRRVGILT